MKQPSSRRPWWRRLRVSVRSLMVLVLLVGGVLGWFIRRATIQRDAIKAIVAAGGTVRYDFEQGFFRERSPGPKWLVNLIGIDYFADVTSVSFRTPPFNSVVYTPRQTDQILASIGRLPNLENLDAASVLVTDSGMAHLAGLKKLRFMGIEGTPQFTDKGLAHLANLECLEGLSIQGTMGIEGPGLSHLAGLTKLKSLMIDIKTDKGLEHLSQLTSLNRLSLGMGNVTDEAAAQLSRLTWLKDLALGGDAGSNSGLAHLKALKNLEILQIYGKWITDEGMVPILEMEHLSTFLISDLTNVTPGGLYRLQKQRPGLRMGINGSGQVSKARLNLLRSSVGPSAVPPPP